MILYYILKFSGEVLALRSRLMLSRRLGTPKEQRILGDWIVTLRYATCWRWVCVAAWVFMVLSQQHPFHLYFWISFV